MLLRGRLLRLSRPRRCLRRDPEGVGKSRRKPRWVRARLWSRAPLWCVFPPVPRLRTGPLPPNRASPLPRAMSVQARHSLRPASVPAPKGTSSLLCGSVRCPLPLGKMAGKFSLLGQVQLAGRGSPVEPMAITEALEDPLLSPRIPRGRPASRRGRANQPGSLPAEFIEHRLRSFIGTPNPVVGKCSCLVHRRMPRETVRACFLRSHISRTKGDAHRRPVRARKWK